MRILLVLCLLVVPFVAQAQSGEGSKQQGSNVKGDVLYWEGEELVVKEVSGREVRMHVNGETKIEGIAGRLKTGDKIDATVTPDGHAVSIKLQLPDAGPGIR